MSTAILVPVLGRPHRVEPLLANIAQATPEPHSVYFQASDRATVNELTRLGANYWCDQGDTYANRINSLFARTDEPYVFCAADDYFFHPGWLTSALRSFSYSAAGVVVVNDGHNPRGTACLVSRRYIDEQGGPIDAKGLVFHPGYGHNFCDTELFEVARMRGRWIPCRHSLVEHLHPETGKSENDDTYRLGMSSWAHDMALYNDRRRMWT